MDQKYKHDDHQQSSSSTPQPDPQESVQEQMQASSRDIPLTVPSPFSPSFANPGSSVQSYPSAPSSSSCPRAEYKAQKRMLKAQTKASKRETHAIVKEAKHQVKALKHEVKHQAKELKKEIQHQTEEALRTIRSNIVQGNNGCTACPQQQGLDVCPCQENQQCHRSQHRHQRKLRKNRHECHQRRYRHHGSPLPIRLIGLGILAKVVERGLRLLGGSDSNREYSPERQVILIGPPPLDNTPSTMSLMPPGTDPIQNQYLPPTGATEKSLGPQEPLLVYAMSNISLDNRAPAQLSSAASSSSASWTPSAPILTAAPQDPTSSVHDDDEELDASVPPPSYQASIAHHT
ncbi:hypothetical protein BGZ58_004450 [Dissophora ornata]|nr:hypothetical protein BGZ58_004450 [Dissophora ornata]